jgi:hypothetical protein
VDATYPRRHIINVIGVTRAKVNGRAVSSADARLVDSATGGFTVAYAVKDLRATSGPNGSVRITGRVATVEGGAPPVVSLFTYRLSGTVTDAAGKPVQGATIVTRTIDRDFWTFSSPSGPDGKYTSFFAAADDSSENPLQFSVQVAVGRDSYTSGLAPTVKFDRLRSATMNIRLPASTTGVLPLPTAASYAGALYQGLLVGAAANGRVVQPLSAQWPDRSGRFQIVLPASVRGKQIRIWESNFATFASKGASAGGSVELRAWPKALSPRSPAGLAQIALPH